MKFSEQWLREWVNPPLDSEELCEQLSMAGLEVDMVTPAAPAFTGVVVARIVSVEPHPDADKLSLCQVNDGEQGDLHIVCGAPNVEPGMKVPLARIGGVLPSGMQVKRAKLRGVESFGMLCSAAELGLAEQAEGLMLLPEDAPVGTDLREYLNLDDRVIDIDLTPNRGDCLSIAGVAREVAALNACDISPVKVEPVTANLDEELALSIADKGDCSRYVGRIVKGIRANTTTPVWMTERLRRAGIRAIHPVVDVTNYVMLELGQPMHAFDLGKLKGGITVRRAKRGETLLPLVGDKLELGSDDLVIADEGGPVALAGVMGGLDSSVTEATVDILLESACFTPRAVAGTGRRHKLHTDSLHRFERGVDPALQQQAMERATALILEICGGEAGPVIDTGGMPDPRPAVSLRADRLHRLLGFEVPAQRIGEILTGLSMALESRGEGQWQVTPPGFRYDIELEADLIEEVVRIHGYDRVPDTSQRVSLPPMHQSETTLPVERLCDALIHRGYHEAITYSFVDPEKQQVLSPDEQGIDLDNPIARQMSQMRTTVWAGLLQALHYNLQRQQHRVRLFEIGMRFALQGNEIRQQRVISGLAYGDEWPEQWAAKPAPVDFYAVKSDLEALLSLGGEMRDTRFQAGSHPALHPGVCAEIHIDGKTSGYMGALHPNHLKIFDLKGSPILFELDLEAVMTVEIPGYSQPSEFPSMRRDLALVIPEEVTAAALLQCVDGAAEALLTDAYVFDVYRGSGLPSGCKSAALGLNFQDKSRTLTEQEVDAAVTRIQSRLGEELGASIRG